jgi:hypothetical protein
MNLMHYGVIKDSKKRHFEPSLSLESHIYEKEKAEPRPVQLPPPSH